MIALLGAKTGQGHIALLDTLANTLEKSNVEYLRIDDFYESCIPSNKILSDFYNFLLQTSIPLGRKYTEMAAITRPDKLENIYKESQKKIGELLNKKDLKAIISFAPLINYSILRYITELNLKNRIKFYIIVTDPYTQMAPGFDIDGADRYFCFSHYSKIELIQRGIAKSLIEVVNFPIKNEIFKYQGEKHNLYKSFDLSEKKITILLNSGSNGNIKTLKILKELSKSTLNIQIIFLVGRNKNLEKLANLEKIKSKNSILIVPFTENIGEFYEISDICITKPGANTFYECLKTKTIPLIDSTEGLLYQEEGILDFLKEYFVGYLILNYSNIESLIKQVINNRTILLNNLEKFEDNTGASIITQIILKDIEGENNEKK